MQGNQFPSSNENINIQLRLSPLILLSEGLEKEANELCGRSDAAALFFRNGVSKDFFFFSSSRPTKEVEKNYSSSYEGKIEELSPRLCSSPVPTGGHGTGSIPERAGRCCQRPTGKQGQPFRPNVCPVRLPGELRARRSHGSCRDAGSPSPRPPLPVPERCPSPTQPVHPTGESGLPVTTGSARPSRGGMGSWVCPSEPAQDAAPALRGLRLACWISVL